MSQTIPRLLEYFSCILSLFFSERARDRRRPDKQTKIKTTRLRMFNRKPPLALVHPQTTSVSFFLFPSFLILDDNDDNGRQREAWHALSDNHSGRLQGFPRPIASQASSISSAECGRRGGDGLIGCGVFQRCYEWEEEISLTTWN